MSESSDDLSAVAWVHDELRRSLDAAHKALRRYSRESAEVEGSDIDRVDPAVLRTARAQIHQGVGALELVGLPAAALVLRASEALVQRVAAKPKALTPQVIDHIEATSFALLDYLARMLAGKTVSPLSLFPQYQKVQEAAEAHRVHPADLWSVDWRWRELPADATAVPRQADAAAHEALENELLGLMRGAQPTLAARRIGDLCAGLGAGATDAEVATLWRLASAVFQAQAEGLLGFDLFTKRMASRLLAQFRILERGDTDVSERLARDLLFFCARSVADDGRAPRLAVVRERYSLVDEKPVDYSISVLGRFDPALIVLAKKRVVSAKEAWSAVAGGEMHRLAGLTEQFALVGESLKRLFVLGDTFATELQAAVAQTQGSKAAPAAPLAMEVATSLLYIEAALEDGDFDDAEHASRVGRLAERLRRVRKGHAPDALEGWMEELYRRVSSRQTMGSVVQELRASLAEAEQGIDRFFRNPADPTPLGEVPKQLGAMRGVLSVLGMDHASAALLRMRDEIDALTMAGPAEPRAVAGMFDRIAGNLSALGFLIDMLSVQPQLAKSLFAYDADRGTLDPVMGRALRAESADALAPALAPSVEPRLLEQAQMLAFTSVREDVPLQDVARDLERLSHEAQAADQPELAAAVLKAQAALESAGDADDLTSARGQLSEALVDFVAAAEPVVPLPEPAVAPRDAASPTAEISDFQDDDEMRGVFLEEAREVIADAHSACRDLAASPSDLGYLTTLRRAFHTLKGSSRMVGLKDFGEAAWACEQLYNTLLAEQHEAPPAFVEFTASSLTQLREWSDDIAARRPPRFGATALKDKAEALTRQLKGGASARPRAGLPDNLPSAADLDLGGTAASQAGDYGADNSSAAPAPGAAMKEADPGSAFELDLSAFDASAGPAEPAGRSNPSLPSLDFGVGAPRGPFDEPAATEPASLYGADTVPAAAYDFAAIDLDLPGRGAALPARHEAAEGAFEATAPAPLVEAHDSTRRGASAPAFRPEAPELDAGFAMTVLENWDEPPAEAAAAPTALGSGEGPAGDELVKLVGPLRISIPLFNIYLNEADELSRRLATELAEWAMELDRPIGESTIALAHSLAGNSATVGFAELSHLARTLEHAQARSQAIGHGTDEEARLFVDAADEIRRVLHQFAAGFLAEPAPHLLRRLADHELSSARRLEALTGASGGVGMYDAGAAEARPEISLYGDFASDAPGLATAATEPAGFVDTGEGGIGPYRSAAEADGATDAAGASAAAGSGMALQRHAAALPEPAAFLESLASAEALAPTESADAEPLPIDGTATAADRDLPAPERLAVPEPIETVAESLQAGAARFEAEEPAPESLQADSSRVNEPEPSAFGALGGRFDPLGISALKPLEAMPAETMKAAVAANETPSVDDDAEARDAVDPELFPIFEEEGLELLPQLATHLREWTREPTQTRHAAACMRTLHTLKGGARLAGAMRLGDMAHRLETRIEQIIAHLPADEDDLEGLQVRCDAMAQTLEALRQRAANPGAESFGADSDRPALQPVLAPVAAPTAAGLLPGRAPEWQASTTPAAPRSDRLQAWQPIPLPVDSAAAVIKPAAAAPAAGLKRGADAANEPRVLGGADLPPIDWSRFSPDGPQRDRSAERGAAVSQAAVRVRAPLLDRLVNLAGEVSITRSRVESGVSQIKGSLTDLTENLERLRGQLRDIEIQGEVQMSSRLEAAKAAAQSFDPLEFDRFTRFQELTRMMAESVNDVATVQRALQGSLETTEDELVAQARMTRDLHDDLLRTRMVEFEGLSDRLYRVARQAAKETHKQVRLDIVGGSIEIDRGVLDRMTGAFEHLLRNCVTHGIEAPADRVAAGKDPAGSIIVALSHEGNEVGVEFRDDGGGLDLERIRRRGVEMGLLDPGIEPTAGDLTNLIFSSGFSTAETVTELAGRGVGMDVVRSDVVAMGGRIETATQAGKGTSFKLILPLTTAVTQVVMLRCADTTVAVPSTLVETIRRVSPEEADAAYASGTFALGDRALQFFWLGALLQISAAPGDAAGRMRNVVIVRSAQQQIAVHVDDVVGNQEVVVKNLGPQLSRLPGLAGMTLLTSGAVALIYNPVALATLYGDGARAATHAALHGLTTAPRLPQAPEPAVAAAPLVLVVDDSLTVRRVTQRMLVREGYRVVLAKDGLDALERLTEELPCIVLSDIEMPRMDGFDLVRNIRADARLRELPVIMITSRIAQKHRDHATELGVDHYLGKPYSEEDLLALIDRYVANPTRA